MDFTASSSVEPCEGRSWHTGLPERWRVDRHCESLREPRLEMAEISWDNVVKKNVHLFDPFPYDPWQSGTA